MRTTALQVSTPQGASGSVLSGAEDYIFRYPASYGAHLYSTIFNAKRCPPQSTHHSHPQTPDADR